MSIVLKHQVEASEKSADALEVELQHEHRRAMLCYDVQDLVRTVVEQHREVNRDVERWQDELSSGPPEFRREIEHLDVEWDSLYRRLAVVFEKTAKLLKAVERMGFIVDSKAEFFASWHELRGTVCFTLDSVAAAVDQIRRGEVHTSEEIKRELLDRPGH